MSHRLQITITDRQRNFLYDESARSGLPIAELIRRAVDTTYRPYTRVRGRGLELSVGVWRDPDEAVIGRRIRRGRPLRPVRPG